jgi:hypothetical protein
MTTVRCSAADNKSRAQCCRATRRRLYTAPWRLCPSPECPAGTTGTHSRTDSDRLGRSAAERSGAPGRLCQAAGLSVRPGPCSCLGVARVGSGPSSAESTLARLIRRWLAHGLSRSSLVRADGHRTGRWLLVVVLRAGRRWLLSLRCCAWLSQRQCPLTGGL